MSGFAVARQNIGIWQGCQINRLLNRMPFAALVVGIGKVGSRFDEEASRRTVWSHVGAYLARPALFELVAACDPDRVNAEAFRRRCPKVPIYANLSSALDASRPLVVSICTPTDQHAEAVKQSLNCSSVRAIWCEKPLTTNTEEGAKIVNACASQGVHLLVSYTRRWMPIWRRAREIVESGSLGTARVVRISLPNRILSIGSHAIDLMQFLGGEIVDASPFALPALEQEGESALAGMFRLQGGAYGIFQVTGWKANYLVEAEVLGDEGRIIVREDLDTITFERFEKSSRYAGYRELGVAAVERIATGPTFSPFVAIADEIASLLTEANKGPTCSGYAALAVDKILERMTSIPGKTVEVM
jgi:predicted dehydrogenase